MTTENSVYDTEDILIALFDAHYRVMQEKVYQLNKCETHREREMVIQSFERFSYCICNTAVDQIQRNEQLLEERGEL